MFRKLVIIFLLLLATVLLIWKNLPAPDLQKEAEKILSNCQNEDFTPTCYDREIPKLMKFLSMEEAFKVTEYVQQKDSKYNFCHVLAHKLSYLETEKTPDDWLEVMARCPATMCNNGCPHGVLMYKFQSESLTDEQTATILPQLTRVCEPRGTWQPSEVELGMCYHGLGHLNMYISQADVNKSLALCLAEGVKEDGRNYYQTCAQGVFMIIFQGVEPDDFALVADIKPEKENLSQFCSQWTGLEQNACRTEAWPLYADQITKPQGLADFCSYTTDVKYQRWCYETGLSLRVIELLEADANHGLQAVADFCLALPGDKKDLCFAFAATRFIQVDPDYTQTSVKLCQLADGKGLGERCWHDLLFYSKYSFKDGTAEQKNYCSKLPGTYGEKCLKGEVPDNFYGID